MDSWGMSGVKLRLGICRHLLVLELRGMELELERSIVEGLVVAIGSIVGQLGQVVAIGSIEVGLGRLVVGSSGWQVLGCGGRRCHRVGSLGTCVGQHQLGIGQLFVLKQQPRLSRGSPKGTKPSLVTAIVIRFVIRATTNPLLGRKFRSSFIFNSPI
jgi:hypothetical protein